MRDKTPPLDGLGEKPDRIKRLLDKEPDVLRRFEEAMTGPKHVHFPDDGNSNIRHQRGMTKLYVLRRLAKDYPELYAKVCRKEMSANAAARCRS